MFVSYPYSLIMEHNGHVSKMSVSGYSDRQFTPMLRQCVVRMNKTFNPHCIIRLSCETSTEREHFREACLFSTMRFQEEIARKNQRIRNISVKDAIIRQIDLPLLQHYMLPQVLLF